MLNTVWAFLLTLGVLIIVHEWGHYRVARACGVKVLRFSVGIGPVIWRRQKDAASTEFVLSALPLGGYVRMLDEADGAVPPAMWHQTFNRQPLRKRAAIVMAGPLANLLLAVVLYAAAHWIGNEEPAAVLATPSVGSLAERAGLHAGDRVLAWAWEGEDQTPVKSMNDVRWAVTQGVMKGQSVLLQVSAGAHVSTHEVLLHLESLPSREVNAATWRRVGIGQVFAEPVLGDVKPGGPAALAGLQKGDRVLSVDGQPVPDALALRQWLRSWPEEQRRRAAMVSSPQGQSDVSVPPQPMVWQVERGGSVLRVELTPAVSGEGEERVGRMEAMLGAAPEMVWVQHGWWSGLALAVERTWDMSRTTLEVMFRMVTGEASLKNLTGPLTIADVAGQSVQLGLAYYLGFLAVVSISLGVLNLLPLPMLDGGHLMYYLFEAVTGRPVAGVWLERLQRGGVAIMLMMMSLALYNDVARLLGLH